MQTIDEVREHCRFVGNGIEKMVEDGEFRAALVELFDTLYYT